MQVLALSSKILVWRVVILNAATILLMTSMTGRPTENGLHEVLTIEGGLMGRKFNRTRKEL